MSQAHAVQRSDEVKEPADAQQGGRKAIIAAVFANLAIAVNPEVTYVHVKAADGREYLLAEALIRAIVVDACYASAKAGREVRLD